MIRAEFFSTGLLLFTRFARRLGQLKFIRVTNARVLIITFLKKNSVLT